MDVLIFWFWVIITVAILGYSILKRDIFWLFISSLFFLAFSFSLTFDGLEINNGINKATGAYTYTIITPFNDSLLTIFGVVGFVFGFGGAFYSMGKIFSYLFGSRKRLNE